MASTTALPPPPSRTRQEAGQLHLPACFCYKACAGHFTCRLFYCKAYGGQLHLPAVLLQGLCRSASPPACFATTALSCLALSACLCHDPMPASLVAFAPIHYQVRQDHRASCRDCPVGSRTTGLHWQPMHRFVCLRRCSFTVLQGLPCRQPHHGTALQPVHRVCLHPSIHPSIRSVACVCLRQCPFSVLQGLPCRQPHTETAFVQPVHRFVFTALISRGRSRTALVQPATFPAQHLHLLHEPETACG